MTPSRLRHVMDRLDWSQHHLAVYRLGISPWIVKEMLDGKRVIPGDLAHWLEDWLAYTEANPPPLGWHRGPGRGSRRRDDMVAVA